VKRTIQFVILALATLLVSDPVLADASCAPQMSPDCHRMANCCGMTEMPGAEMPGMVQETGTASAQHLFSASAWEDVTGCNPEECYRPSSQTVASLANSAKNNPVALTPSEPFLDVAPFNGRASSSFPSSAHAPPRYLLFHVIRI